MARETMMTLEELKEKVAEAVNAEPSQITMESGNTNIEGWDSMGTLRILSMLDDHVDSPITPQEAESLVRSFSAIVEFARNRGILDN